MTGGKPCVVRNRFQINGRSQQLGKLAGFTEGVMGREFPSRDDYRTARRQQARCNLFNDQVRRPDSSVYARGTAAVEFSFVVEDIARQADKHRAGGWRERDFCGAVKDPRQIFDAQYLDRPFNQWLGDRNQRFVEHGFLQPITGFILPGGDYQRRAGKFRVV